MGRVSPWPIGERLTTGTELTFGDRDPNGGEQLYEDEQEKQRIQRLNDRVRAEVVDHVRKVLGGDSQQHERSSNK